MLAQVLESLMLICFGLSWPINAYKSYKAATAAGSSWQFIGLITLGYLAGIAAKFIAGQVNWVLIVYFLNLGCLAINWAVYIHNVKLDRARVEKAAFASGHALSLGCALIATDGSQSACKAAAFAADMLDLQHAESVELLAVAPNSSSRARAQADAALAKTAQVLRGRGIDYAENVAVGLPATSIVEAAVTHDATLVVMGSRGLSGLKEAILGSVSREVADNVACPVFIVK